MLDGNIFCEVTTFIKTLALLKKNDDTQIETLDKKELENCAV